jgi:hypothetical protein
MTHFAKPAPFVPHMPLLKGIIKMGKSDTTTADVTAIVPADNVGAAAPAPAATVTADDLRALFEGAPLYVIKPAETLQPFIDAGYCRTTVVDPVTDGNIAVCLTVKGMSAFNAPKS